MRLVALIEDELVAEKILRHLGMPTRAPPRHPPARLGQQRPIGVSTNESDYADPPCSDR